MELSEINFSYLLLGLVFYLGYKQFQVFDRKLDDLKEMTSHNLKQEANCINKRLDKIQRSLGIETSTEELERWLSESTEESKRFRASPEGFMSLWMDETKAIRQRGGLPVVVDTERLSDSVPVRICFEITDCVLRDGFFKNTRRKLDYKPYGYFVNPFLEGYLGSVPFEVKLSDQEIDAELWAAARKNWQRRHQIAKDLA